MNTQSQNNSFDRSESTNSAAALVAEAGVCEPCGVAIKALMVVNDPHVCESISCLLSAGILVSHGTRDGVELLSAEHMLKGREVAELLDASEDWVRRHKCELGAVNLNAVCGSDKRGAEWRYPMPKVEEYLKRCARLSCPSRNARKAVRS